MGAAYIKGKFATAACDLHSNLSDLGIRCTVGYDGTRREKELFVYVERRADLFRVPKTFGEFEVVAEVVGVNQASELKGGELMDYRMEMVGCEAVLLREIAMPEIRRRDVEKGGTNG